MIYDIHGGERFVNIETLLVKKMLTKFDEGKLDPVLSTPGRVDARIQSLRIRNHIDLDHLEATSGSDYCQQIRRLTKHNSSLLKRKRIKPYSKKDAEKAINFIESYLIYIAQLNRSNESMEPKFELKTQRAINCLEHALLELQLTKKERKASFHRQLSRAEKLLEKILTDYPPDSGVPDFEKKIRLAFEILHKF